MKVSAQDYANSPMLRRNIEALWSGHAVLRTRIRLGRDGSIEQIEWGRLNGDPLVLISGAMQSGAADVVHLIQGGKLVWAAIQMPFGTTLGGLLRIGTTPDGQLTLDLAPGGALRSFREMPQF